MEELISGFKEKAEKANSVGIDDKHHPFPLPSYEELWVYLQPLGAFLNLGLQHDCGCWGCGATEMG